MKTFFVGSNLDMGPKFKVDMFYFYFFKTGHLSVLTFRVKVYEVYIFKKH